MDLSGVELAGKVALVTGASGGLGCVIARAAARAGARVVLTGRELQPLQKAVRAVDAEGGQALAIPTNPSDERAIQRCVEHALDTWGAIDVLVNNAAQGGPINSVWNADAQDWWRTFETNLRGPFLWSRSVLPSMIGRREGTIINMASHAGVLTWPLCSAYAVSKCALIKFSENLAEETVGHNISVFALHPGLLTIGMTETLLASQQTPGTPSEQVANWFRRQIAQGRAVAPERAAEAVVALASGRYAPLSGCYLTVDDDLDVLAARAARDRDPHLNRLRLAIAGAALQ